MLSEQHCKTRTRTFHFMFSACVCLIHCRILLVFNCSYFVCVCGSSFIPTGILKKKPPILCAHTSVHHKAKNSTTHFYSLYTPHRHVFNVYRYVRVLWLENALLSCLTCCAMFSVGVVGLFQFSAYVERTYNLRIMFCVCVCGL